MKFTPGGQFNVASDPSDLPETEGISSAVTRCKNLRLNENGKAITRDGSAKLNSTAIGTPIYWIEEQGGTRYSFAGTQIYSDETSIETGLTSAQWAAIQYNAYNDTTEQIYALNGTDRKRIESGVAYEWGIAAPTTAPTLSAGQSTGLTGAYNVKYTYIRKVGTVTVAESNPSPEATAYIQLSNQSLAVSVTTPSDSQVTHIRLYRTLADGIIYYRDQDIPTATYSYGICFSWEGTDAYISGTAYKFTVTDSTHTTENTYTWEADLSEQTDDNPAYGGNDWYTETYAYYQIYLTYILSQGGTPLSYAQFLEQYGP